MTTTINDLPPEETRLILEWVNEPNNAAICKSWRAATEQRVAMLMNSDQGYFHSKILRPFLPSSAPPSTYPEQMRFMAAVIKNVRAYCELTPNTAPPILSAHKPIETADLEEIVTQVNTQRSEQDLIIFMVAVNSALPPDQQFHPSSPSLTNAQIGDEIRLFFQNHQSAIQKVTSLYFSSSNLFSLPPEIAQFVNLQRLDVNDNHLTSLPSEIGHLVNLQRLNVSNNNLTSLPPEIRHLVNLQWLDVPTNNLTSLPPEIRHLVNLQFLDVSNNNLTSLPPEIGNLVNLIRLEVTNNNLTSLPPEIGLLVNLYYLIVFNNQITTLPPEIVHLVNLLELYVGNNNITSLPPEIGQLVNLLRLDVYNNHITSLPPEIGHLVNLIRLEVSNNLLTSLPPEIGHLVNLQKLDVSNNNLTSLPSEIGRLNLLSFLDLSYNLAITINQTMHNRTMSALHQSPTDIIIETFRQAHPNCRVQTSNSF